MSKTNVKKNEKIEHVQKFVKMQKCKKMSKK